MLDSSTSIEVLRDREFYGIFSLSVSNSDARSLRISSSCLGVVIDLTLLENEIFSVNVNLLGFTTESL